jgi:hypothetical protein
MGLSVSVIGVHRNARSDLGLQHLEVSHVLHKCVNPACHNPFRELSLGKLFLVETKPFEGPEARRAHWRGRSSHGIEYYWLCDECAFALTLSYEKGRGVVTVPRPDFAKKKPVVAVPAAGMPRGESSRGGQPLLGKER